MTSAPAPGAGGDTGFRPDIEGLRAVAVVLILLYHAGVGVLTGGYVGVDVFFVISGFLITGMLVRELGETGRLDLLDFYARRARRILPAAFLVLAATLLGYVVLLSPVALWRAAPDLAAAAVYVPNFVFAFDETDYFQPARVSPVIHYWSLGVEEQFYVVWPALLWLGFAIAARSRAALTGLVGVVVAGSFLLSVSATDASPTAAFYLLPTRAWELGAGALVALAGTRARIGNAALAGAAGLVGLALIALSAVAFDESTPFPGLAAVPPVLGTTLVVVAGVGGRPTWAAATLSSAPMRWVGRISYSLYLWHWPMLIFAGAVLAGAPAAIQAAAGVAVSVALAAATYRWLEDPLRRGRFIGRRPEWNLAGALFASGVMVAASLGAGQLAVAPFREGAGEPAAEAPPAVGRPAASEPPVAGEPVASEPPSGGDLLAGLFSPAGPTPDNHLPDDLVPPVLHLHRGEVVDNPRTDGCSLQTGETVNGPCTYGDPRSERTVVLLGDSHLAQWWPALERIMAARDWKVVVLVKTSCTYADVPTMGASGPKSECDTWRAAALDRIAAEQPDLVLLAGNHRAPPIADGVALDGDAAWAAMGAGVVRTIDGIQATGAQVVVLADTPQVPFDPSECLTDNADHVLRCAVPRDQALDVGWVEAERVAAQGASATFIDVNAWACSSDPCPAVVGRYAVFADSNHLTTPFVQALTSRLDAALPD